MPKPTKRDIIEFMLGIYPQGNPFLNRYAECFASVNAKFGVYNKKYFKTFFYRLNTKFKSTKVKGNRNKFWKLLEKTENLENPFEADTPSTCTLNASQTASPSSSPCQRRYSDGSISTPSSQPQSPFRQPSGEALSSTIKRKRLNEMHELYTTNELAEALKDSLHKDGRVEEARAVERILTNTFTAYVKLNPVEALACDEAIKVETIKDEVNEEEGVEDPLSIQQLNESILYKRIKEGIKEEDMKEEIREEECVEDPLSIQGEITKSENNVEMKEDLFDDDPICVQKIQNSKDGENKTVDDVDLLENKIDIGHI